METRHYICDYCQKEYLPRRRGIQKYCSNSCRSRGYQIKSKSTSSNLPVKKETESLVAKSTSEKKAPAIKVDSMSSAGVGNSTTGTVIGNAAYELGKAIFTPEVNKPATKGDLNKIAQLISNQYLPILNLGPNNLGYFPHYDTKTQKLVYLKNRS
ncbi:MAG: hypothetical protein BM564_03785 [Bacteroidetes bacterium MedPE-SWsnd-G2]|nr:MAG: hypothetical protein BM564_03785 [Bacteroidetes bacterium MedPE-SWsnd-G2]